MLRQYFRYVSDGMAAQFRKANGTQALTKHTFWRDTLTILFILRVLKLASLGNTKDRGQADGNNRKQMPCVVQCDTDHESQACACYGVTVGKHTGRHVRELFPVCVAVVAWGVHCNVDTHRRSPEVTSEQWTSPVTVWITVHELKMSESGVFLERCVWHALLNSARRYMTFRGS
jgi:hypothetical protein